MKISATVQVLVKQHEGVGYLCPCLIKLQATTSSGEKKVKEFKNFFKGKNIQEVLNLVGDYFFSIFTKPTSFVLGTNNQQLLEIIKNKTPHNFQILKTICKDSPIETINKLNKILEESIEFNPKTIIPNYLFFSYDDIVSGFDEKEATIQLALYLKMIANYFNSHPEQLIDELPVFISMKNKNLLPEEVETVEDFLIHISS